MTSTARAAQSDGSQATPPPAATAAEATPTQVSRLAALLRGPYAWDVGVCLLFVALAWWVTHGLWPSPGSRVMALNPEDQVLYEWFLAADTKFAFGDLSLLTDRLNAPEGVNLLANTTVIALGTLFTPVTLLFGVPTTFALIAGGNLAGTAIAWYFLYRRLLSASPLAAAIGGGLCGFGPGIISQNNSHLHMTAQWLVPVMVWLVVRMVRAADPERGEGRRRLVTSGVGLGLVVTLQVFIGEEVLFLTAITLAFMTIAYAVARRPFARRVGRGFALGLAVTAGTAGVLLAYPLWFQFAGPQSVPNGVFSPHYFSADLASFVAVSPLSIAGSAESARLSTGAAEYNTFLGWPLVLLTLVCAGWLIRRPLVLACAVAGILMTWLSLGPHLVVNRVRTDILGPYAALTGLPVVEGALPMRFALALLPLVATVLVLTVDAVRTSESRATRLVVPGAILVALMPIFPAPLPTAVRPPLPQFITGGHWRDCVEPGGVLVPVPLPTPPKPWAMRWGAAVNADFGIPEGFFIGPYGYRGRASMGIAKRPTSQLLDDVAVKGGVPPVGEEQRRQARDDLAYWGSSCVVLADDAPRRDDLRATLEALFGPGTRAADAWYWKP
ncbi:hypothetical protein WEI85_01520 [Actinomycetes bacterium KLBMP 9797]